jgi:zinc-ribbon domain
MKKFYGTSLPTAHICVNKGRIKIYQTQSTQNVYLSKGQEFEIELFNPTTSSLLAKIFLDGQELAGGGIVLRQGEKVYLERYLTSPKKFMFDTYEVSNSEVVKQAIENNGNFKVVFYREHVPVKTVPLTTTTITTVGGGFVYPSPTNYSPLYTYTTNSTGLGNIGSTNRSDTTYNAPINSFYSNTGGSTDSFPDTPMYKNFLSQSDITMDWMEQQFDRQATNNDTLSRRGMLNDNVDLSARKLRSKKTIETGRIEEGSVSNQKMTTVNKVFESFPVHTVEYKMLPISQKISDSSDINVRQYCTSCGKKIKKGDKFCSACGARV